MKQIHYTVGYGGSLNYHTECGKEIHSHSKTDGATINPIEVNCNECRTDKWSDDLQHSIGAIKTDIKRRIYIESDILHADEIRSVKREVREICKKKSVKCIERVFSEILDYAWHDLNKTWGSVKKADEIYARSSLMPLAGGSYMGAPVIFNGMCERAINEKVKGKDVYMLVSLEDIDWDMIDMSIMRKAFKHNNLYVYNDEFSFEMQKVDISNIKS